MLFLSYALEGAEIARRMAEALRVEGFDVWLDQPQAASNDEVATNRALERSLGMLVIVTSSSAGSEHVRHALGHAATSKSFKSTWNRPAPRRTPPSRLSRSGG